MADPEMTADKAVTVHLTEAQFGERERELARCGALAASTFRYDNGIAALRVANARGEIVMLPFKGQQIWRARFDGRDLTMKSMFDTPRQTTNYLENYGAFLIHCGMSAIGAPGPQDDHPLHGEVPNMVFDSAFLRFDPAAGTVTIGGVARYSKAFAIDYRLRTEVTLGADAAVLDVAVTVDNLMGTEIAIMYLGHVNFRPVDGAKLVYSAPYTPEAIRVREAIPRHITPRPGYPEFLAALAKDPGLHHDIKPDLAFDPEVVFDIAMQTDAEGWAHALQRHPDGTADYVAHRPAQLSRAIRWISRTGDQDALGLVLPSTSGTEGRTVEKAAGRHATVPAHGTWHAGYRTGLLTPGEAAGMAAHIDAICGRD
ncbi:DUF4432 family protein [Pelagibacterium xiamenense]|uniref:DUF4432 family protein n=1 Tax=Pelagibacterium xiamenense TaxID=2901140 RepID=UPI001E2DD6D6|nr:DUF4432 family protein [Pelagibacterium xiamenense]MCD7059151.1 DUF4432 family protein [Pelagibacterium xiamenense]